MPPSNRNCLAFAPKGIASTTPYSQGSQASLRIGTTDAAQGVPWVAPINVALKRLKRPTVTPSATSTLSASLASLFLYRFSDAFSFSFSSSLAYAGINLYSLTP